MFRNIRAASARRAYYLPDMTDAAIRNGAAPSGHGLPADIASLALCSVIWGTTWYAITLQFGAVPITWSIAYRFGLGAAAILLLCLALRQPVGMNRRQHLFAFLQGLFTFAIDYWLVYAAEERVLSGVVAVIFASLALVNLIVFRLAAGRRASRLAWGGAILGVTGVGVLSASELLKADLAPAAVVGVVLAMGAVLAGALGNLFASRVQEAGARVLPATGWAMGYGAALLALFALVRGEAPAFDPSAKYVLSLLYLSLFGSVIAFVVFYALARRRSYTFASYIAALTPPTAMLVSALLEGAHWGPLALVGLGLVVAGQGLLIRAPST